MAARIKVGSSKPYTVTVEKGALDRAGEYTASLTRSRHVALITDDTVNELYGDRTVNSLENAGISVSKFVFPHGESSKTPETYINIVNFLSREHLTRSDAVIALGGGVVGDIAGFSAATYLRGIDYIQMPTTLLSAVDSSVGGKCAVDLPMGKNLLGAFHQPIGVLCDYSTLDTLPKEYFLDGCGEVLKYGILYSPELFAHLEKRGAAFDREYVISSCVSLKAEVVARDEFDTGERALLNLGHTVGHAIEKLSGMKISHGAAVATGCAIIARACEKRGFCSAATAEKVCAAVTALGHRTDCDFDAMHLAEAILSDKKRHGDTVDFVIIEDIGKCKCEAVSTNAIEDFLSLGL